MIWFKRICLVALAILVIAGHIGLWASPDYTGSQKLRLTILNGVVWAVIVLPAIAVSLWARAHRGRD